MKNLKIAFLTTFPPTKCGIATFSNSLISELNQYLRNKVKIIRVARSFERNYSNLKIRKNIRADYKKAALEINASDIDLVVVQHEYGIYGGQNGEYVLDFIENLDKPFVITLHSVLKNHTDQRFLLTAKILNLSLSVIVMTKNAKKILQEAFKINSKKIEIIRHGVPAIKIKNKKIVKQSLGFSQKIVISTFGLIGRGKGIELVLEALKDLAIKFPNITYLIIGATHPEFLKQEGETYRFELVGLVSKYNLAKNVIFINAFLSQQNLVEFLAATDIYVAPQRDLNQAVSGTVAYAMGCGCAVITSKTPFAKEVLAKGRGYIIDPQPDDIARKIEDLLKNPSKLRNIQKKAYKFALPDQWSKNVRQYLKVIRSAWKRSEIFKKQYNDIPNLGYLFKMTDSFGIVQHSYRSKPNLKYGYSLDDQARALIVTTNLLEKFPNNLKLKKLSRTYFSFLKKAVDQNGIIHNFFDRKRLFIDSSGSADSLARSFWSLAKLIRSDSTPSKLKMEAIRIIEKYKSAEIEYIHPAAYYLLGYSELRDIPNILKVSKFLLSKFNENTTDGWAWFSEKLTWSNGIIPLALLKAFQQVYDQKLLDVAMRSIKFLERHTFNNQGIPLPIGQNGWFSKKGKRAIYDQQPLEASSMILLYLELYKLFKDPLYLKKAKIWLSWYYGNNIGNETIFNSKTFGIHDGLTKNGLNQNQGAESIVTYLLARSAFLTTYRVRPALRPPSRPIAAI